MWKFLVKNQSIEIVEREILADHQIQYVQFKFTFDGDWKRFHKVVQFSQCDEVYSVVLGTEGTTLYLPAELHAGAAKMAIFGYDTESDTTMRATTVPVTLNIRESGFEGDEPPIPPTPDLYTQLLKRIAGKAGLNAHLGTNDMREILKRIQQGDKHAQLIVDAMIYHIAKNIAAESAVLCGNIDAILITGGMAHSDYIISRLRKRIGFLAPVYTFPGEDEMEALALNALAVLQGKREAKVYV